MDFHFPQGNDLLKRIQAVEFEMALAIRDVFERNDVRYVIEYGSLLGAIRHGGFIPWDDDFDFVVFEEDYEKASQALRRELSPKYILHDKESDPNYFYSFSKVRHLNSLAIERVSTDSLRYKGVSIDLFKGNIEQNNRFARRLFVAKSHAKSHWNKFRDQMKVGDLAKTIVLAGKTVGLGVAHAITPKTAYFHKTPIADQYFIPLDKYLPLSRVLFEGESFSAPRDPEFVLTDRYGNWKKYPEQIEFHIKKVEFFDDL